MPKLNQVVGVERLVKQRAFTELTDAHRYFGKPALLSGISRVYLPRIEGGEPLPPESTRVQVKASEMLSTVAEALTKLFDVTATKDWGNLVAKGDIVIDGQALLTDVPPTYLLFLTKQLTDLRTFIGGLPVLDPAEEWTYDPASAVYRTPERRTVRTVKTPRNHVKAAATDKFPAQVEVYHEDVPVGDWVTVKYSGALPAERIILLTNRLDALLKAVKYAQEAANAAQVDDIHVGKIVFDYLFG